ncbi:hypothetical protein [Paracoccus yeei]|uniref:hypothetical protein n=1 Tax=Paracoccus yeei TaxID=147645 RepID=UPI001E4EB02D|nr:hypothetical protein [Paracoccus yeei]
MIAKAFRCWKLSRRIAWAEAEILGRDHVSAKHGLDAPLVVSLTAYPARYDAVYFVLRSLLAQTVRPDRIILWLDPGDDALLPDQIAALDIEIRTCPN